MMLQGTLEKEKIGKIVELLKQSKSILFITGAGISADSGLPTYRGEGGLYNTTATDEGIPIETILAGEMIKTRPELVWKYLGQIEKRTRTAKFNRAHEVIAEMEKHFPHVLVFTQNIDGFHAQAGSKNVIDIHGDMHKVYCPKCFWSKKLDNYEQLSSSPTCPDCGAVIRPDVVFFGENLPEDKI
ncbi:MAG: NAD-dependent protein deacylase, partial [Candidatus Omnitrophica bacterium]|nr:NAD-dependent protein deacylase [Candidatus Omnitrophota bacterium]